MLAAFQRLAAHLYEQVTLLDTSPFARSHVPVARIEAFRALLRFSARRPQEESAVAEAVRKDSAFHAAPAALAGAPASAQRELLLDEPIANRTAARLQAQHRAG